MIIQYKITDSVWIPITTAGESGACWLDEQNDDAKGSMDIRIYHDSSTPDDADFTKAKRVYSEILLFMAEDTTDIYYAKCASGSEAILSVDTGIGCQVARIIQASYSKDAIIATTYADDYIVRGNGFQIQRRIANIPNTGTYKCVLDFSAAVGKIIFLTPLIFSATGGPIYFKTYQISSYTGGSEYPVLKLNNLPSNTNESVAVVKHGISSSDVAGDDLREYEIGSSGNPQQVNRSGQTGGSSPLILPGGGISCLEIDNNYSDVVNVTIGILWYEL